MFYSFLSVDFEAHQSTGVYVQRAKSIRPEEPLLPRTELCNFCRLNVKVLLHCAISLIWKIFTLSGLFLNLENRNFCRYSPNCVVKCF